MTKKIEILDTDISDNRRLSARRIYVVTTEVHVKENATLTIENGTTILIKNGLVADSKLRRAALIFDQGSALRIQDRERHRAATWHRFYPPARRPWRGHFIFRANDDPGLVHG